jgi:hypothetical protein
MFLKQMYEYFFFFDLKTGFVNIIGINFMLEKDNVYIYT